MTITPISGINLSNEITKTAQAVNKPNSQTNSDSFVSFNDIFNNAIDQASSTESITNQDAIKVATGQTDDLHTVMINSAKADLALQTLVEIRNKVIDAYNEVMKITL
jgi:flagellar hook-basal body complex protein FliE